MRKDHHYFVYIMAARRNGTLYVGMTNDILHRSNEHAAGEGGYFTHKYQVKMLVWFEEHQYADQALAREKIVKKYLRREKLALIEAMNPQWRDLADEMRD